MSHLVGNPEDRFSQNEAQIEKGIHIPNNNTEGPGNAIIKPEAHGHNALLNIQFQLNRKLSISVAMTTNQSFGQNLHGWKKTTPETIFKTFVEIHVSVVTKQ